VDPFHQEIAYISPPSIPPDPLVDGVEWMTTLIMAYMDQVSAEREYAVVF
jgi:hypothetical protein